MGIGSLLDVSRNALFAQTEGIRVIGDNIANVNTPSYSRRRIQLSAQGTIGSSTLSIGTGVTVNQINRVVDNFVNSQFLTRISDRAKAQIRQEFLDRAEAPFALGDNVSQIGTQLSNFFSALQDLKANPSNIGLRQNVIESGKTLTDSINSTASALSGLQREADGRIGVHLTDLNSMTSSVALLNVQIARSEIGEQKALSLRDQRDQLLRDISEIANINTLESSDGQVMVSLDNGFALVTGSQSFDLELTNDTGSGSFPPGLDGLQLGHIVYNYGTSATPSYVDLTGVVGAGTGTLAGLLTLRGIQSSTDTTPYDANGDLVELASMVEAISQDLLTRFNSMYLGDVNNDGTPDDSDVAAGFQPSAADLNGNPPSTYGLFSFNGATDSNANGLPDDLAAIGLSSYSSIISFGVTDPSKLAAALDLDAATNGVQSAPGDSTNIDRLLALRDSTVNYSVGNFSQTSTIDNLYSSTVSVAGSKSSSAIAAMDFSSARETQVSNLQASASGVSLDEEFANLINFQRAFEASARMIKLADDLLGQLISLAR